MGYIGRVPAANGKYLLDLEGSTYTSGQDGMRTNERLKARSDWEPTFQDGWFGGSGRVRATAETGLKCVCAIVGRLAVHGRVCSGEGRVDGRAVEILVVRGRGAGGGSSGSVAGVGGGRVALGYLRAVLRRGRGRRRGGGHGGLVGCGVGSGLEVRRARLLLEDGVVAHALTFAFLAIATNGVGFVALDDLTLARMDVR